MLKKLGTVAAVFAIAAFAALSFQGDVGAASLSTYVSMSVTPTLTDTVGLATTKAEGTVKVEFTLANGTGANQANKVYTHTYTIADAGTESIDLQGALVDAFGAGFTPAKLKLVLIYSRPNNTTNLTVLGDVNSAPILSAAATTFTLGPGDPFLIGRRGAAGIAITAGTGDIIKIVNGAGAAAVVDVVFVGTSA